MLHSYILPTNTRVKHKSRLSVLYYSMAKDRPKGPITTKDPLEAADGLQKILSMAFYSQYESYHKETYDFVTINELWARRAPGHR